ncbi:MAG: hypothetical protein LC774_03085 [Acidobacteria bacterium]|nr:hypothetical protein [Acidobacteriota bacterium]
MLKDLLAKVWRGSPAGVRRLGVWLAEPRFTVTAGAVVVDAEGRVLLFKHAFRRGSGWGTATQQVEILFLARPLRAGDARAASAEVSAVEWFERGALPTGLSKDQRRLIDLALETAARRGE